MKTCLVCGKELEITSGLGRPIETCSTECRAKRKNVQREESRQRAAKRGCPGDMHGTSTGYTHFKCTCPKCRLWSSQYQKHRRAAQVGQS